MLRPEKSMTASPDGMLFAALPAAPAFPIRSEQKRVPVFFCFPLGTGMGYSGNRCSMVRSECPFMVIKICSKTGIKPDNEQCIQLFFCLILEKIRKNAGFTDF